MAHPDPVSPVSPIPQPDATTLSRGYMIALISSVILSTTAIFIRYLVDTYAMPSFVLAFWRDLLVMLTLLIVLSVRRRDLLRVDVVHLRYLFLYGGVLAIFNALWTISVALNGAAVSTVLVYSSAAFTAILGWWLLNEVLDWTRFLAIALSFGGCILVAAALDAAAWRANFVGIVVGIVSGLSYAVYSLMGRSAAQRGLNPWTTLLYIFAFAAIFLLIFNFLPLGQPAGTQVRTQISSPDVFWLGASIKGWLVLFLLAAGPTLTGYGLYNVSLTYLPSGVANLIVSLEPAFTALIAYAVFNERLSGEQLLGCVMILAGVIVLRGGASFQMRRRAAREKAAVV
ncbi:MAG: DMT family transporter [Anaerolineae bacterium]|nr:DMT family transporter [Anaerolineae bacterium]